MTSVCGTDFWQRVISSPHENRLNEDRSHPGPEQWSTTSSVDLKVPSHPNAQGPLHIPRELIAFCTGLEVDQLTGFVHFCQRVTDSSILNDPLSTQAAASTHA